MSQPEANYRICSAAFFPLDQFKPLRLFSYVRHLPVAMRKQPTGCLLRTGLQIAARDQPQQGVKANQLTDASRAPSA